MQPGLLESMASEKNKVHSSGRLVLMLVLMQEYHFRKILAEDPQRKSYSVYSTITMRSECFACDQYGTTILKMLPSNPASTWCQWWRHPCFQHMHLYAAWYEHCYLSSNHEQCPSHDLKTQSNRITILWTEAVLYYSLYLALRLTGIWKYSTI